MTTIQGVPETITRADYTRLIESVGLDTRDLLELRFTPKGIHATVYAVDSRGRRYLAETHKGGEIATHQVFIRVEDPT